MKIRARMLLIVSFAAVLVGIILWMVVGPAVVRAALAPVSRDHEWSFFQAYSWLSGPPAELRAIWWIGFSISAIGFSIFAAGLLGIALTFVLEYSNKRKPKQNTSTPY